MLDLRWKYSNYALVLLSALAVTLPVSAQDVSALWQQAAQPAFDPAKTAGEHLNFNLYVTIVMRIAGKKGIPPQARLCEDQDRKGVIFGVKFHSDGTANGKRHNTEQQNFEFPLLRHSAFVTRYSFF